jgi:hypothetical protein
MLRFGEAAGREGGIVRQTRRKRNARRIRFDMRLYWHCLRTAQLPPRSYLGRAELCRTGGKPRSGAGAHHPRFARVHPTNKVGPGTPIFLLRRASLAHYSSRACFVFGLFRSWCSPVCSSCSLPASAITWAKCPSCKRNIFTRLRQKGKKSIRGYRRRPFRPRRRTFFPSSSPNEENCLPRITRMRRMSWRRFATAGLSP